MIRTLLFGAAGQMGRMVIAELVESGDFSIVAGVEALGNKTIGGDIGGVAIIGDDRELPESDVWLDFSVAAAAVTHCQRAAEIGKPIVVAATGFNQAQLSRIKAAAGKTTILFVPNLSAGVGVMARLAGEAAALLKGDFEAVLEELHHSGKKDAPSGTALLIDGEMTAAGVTPVTYSLRAGGAVGEHTVRFVGSDEELVITHRAWSRRAFARGVPRALKFVVGKSPGFYTLRELFQTGL